MSLCKILLGVSIVGAAFLAYGLHSIFTFDKKPPAMKDGWWGYGSRQDDSDKVNPFKVNIPDKVLKDLNNRLKNARFSVPLEEATMDYGFQPSHLKEVVAYWKDKFDWRKQESALNKFNHFTTKIEGIDIHFIREKPKGKPSAPVFPLLMVHGWPGSIIEFQKILPLLTDPSQDVVFEVICPSIPGYGFSEAPHKKGFSAVDTARIFMKLMTRLGFDQYFLQGGDWGGLVVRLMAMAYPEKTIGMHTNFFQPGFHLKSFLKQVTAGLFPSLMLDPLERDLWKPMEGLKVLIRETGYMHIQATRPDTVGAALVDSPVGLAAYILEKFAVWTYNDSRDLRDGGLTRKFTIDELLTNIMIYWSTENVASSMRYYKENIGADTVLEWNGVRVKVPSGLALFPNEIALCPRVLADDLFEDIVQFTIMPRGGHFAAFEEPHLLANDFRSFVRKVLLRRKKNP